MPFEAILLLIFLGAVVLPSVFGWYALRNIGQVQRGLGALLGGQVIVVPAMHSIARHETTPQDSDAWGALVAVSILAFLTAAFTLWVLERFFKEESV